MPQFLTTCPLNRCVAIKFKMFMPFYIREVIQNGFNLSNHRFVNITLGFVKFTLKYASIFKINIKILLLEF